MKRITKTQILAGAALVVILGLWFDAAYTQFPLYTSNETTYLLHGLALAGKGLLRDDWLAKTVDPTPVFSRLVELSYRHLPEKAVFVWHMVLAGLYLLGLLGVASQVIQRRPGTPSQRRSAVIIVAACLVVLHSRWFELVTTVKGRSEIPYLTEGVAFQNVLGHMYQPSAFGVFLLVSIALFLRGRFLAAGMASAIAATVHPTYILSAIALSLGYLCALAVEKRATSRAARRVVVAGLLLVPIALYVAIAFKATSAGLRAEAASILVHSRIPHHTIPARWVHRATYVQLALVVVALLALRRTRLFYVLLPSFVIVLLGTLYLAVFPSDALALLFPWRPSSFLVPIAWTTLLTWVVSWAASQRLHRLTAFACVGVSMVPTVAGAGMTTLKAVDPNQAAMIAFVHATRRPGQVYLIPPEQERLRLLLEVPVYIDAKSHPYKDIEVREWFSRLEKARRFFSAPECTGLNALANPAQVTHAILPAHLGRRQCAGFRESYRDRSWVVWERNR